MEVFIAEKLIVKSFQRLCHVQFTNRAFHLKNTLCTLCLRGWGFHTMSAVFIYNILQGVSITKLFLVCLVVSQNLGEGTLVQMFCWYVREKWES